MKNIKIAVMTAVVGLGLGFAQAGEVNFDFDGRKSGGFTGVEALKAELNGKQGLSGLPAPEAVAIRARDGQNTELKIKAVVKVAGKIKEETLTCQRGTGADQITNCRKSDSAAISYEELNTLALRQYFSAETLKFADLLNQSKHSYTNQSGPMTFSCSDVCGDWIEYVAHPLPWPVPGIPIPLICASWTHECECTAGCD